MFEILDIHESFGIKTLDTAQSYLICKELSGECGAGSRFNIDTKTEGRHVPGSLRKGELIKRAEESIKKLRVKKVHCRKYGTFHCARFRRDTISH